MAEVVRTRDQVKADLRSAVLEESMELSQRPLYRVLAATEAARAEAGGSSPIAPETVRQIWHAGGYLWRNEPAESDTIADDNAWMQASRNVKAAVVALAVRLGLDSERLANGLRDPQSVVWSEAVYRAERDYVPPEPPEESNTAVTAEVAPAGTRRGRGTAKMLAGYAFLRYYGYENGRITKNPDPIGCNKLAKLADVGPATASAFFRDCFGEGGHRAYLVKCKEPRLASLLGVLTRLAGDDLLPESYTEGVEEDVAMEKGQDGVIRQTRNYASYGGNGDD